MSKLSTSTPPTLSWVAAPQPRTGPKAPPWALEAALAGDGVVFMPAAAGGDERAVVLCASFDGVPMVTADKHVYVPCDWMAREFPEIADLAQKIERRVRAHFGVPR